MIKCSAAKTAADSELESGTFTPARRGVCGAHPEREEWSDEERHSHFDLIVAIPTNVITWKEFARTSPKDLGSYRRSDTCIISCGKKPRMMSPKYDVGHCAMDENGWDLALVDPQRRRNDPSMVACIHTASGGRESWATACAALKFTAYAVGYSYYLLADWSGRERPARQIPVPKKARPQSSLFTWNLAKGIGIEPSRSSAPDSKRRATNKEYIFPWLSNAATKPCTFPGRLKGGLGNLKNDR